jgi:hypothetical protein
VIRLLADANIQGQTERLVARMQAEPWLAFWEMLDLQLVRFSDVGLDPADSDAIVWHRCQQEEVFLLTDNRNDDGPDSLAATIRAHNTSRSLPVFTIGKARNLSASAEYMERVIDRLVDYLLDLSNIRGTGRLYLP